MKILYWMAAFFPEIGGVERVAADLLPALMRRGHECAILTSHREFPLSDLEMPFGIPTYRMPFEQAILTQDLELHMRLVKQVAAFKREFTPDVIHIFGIGGIDLFELQTRKTFSAPLFLTLQGEESSRYKGKASDSLFLRVLMEADWVSCVAETETQRLSTELPDLAPRISTIPNALPLPDTIPSPLPMPPRLACIGRLVKVKNFGMAIRAFALVAPEFPQARLVFAGDGPERAGLEELTRELGLTEVVEFLGWMPPSAIPDFVNTVTAVVLPSNTEGLPLVAVQAAQLGRPVLATAVGGVPEIVQDGVTGLLVPRQDVMALAEAMRIVLGDPARAQAMGQAARAQSTAQRDFEAVVAAYEQVYERLTAARQNSHPARPAARTAPRLPTS